MHTEDAELGFINDSSVPPPSSPGSHVREASDPASRWHVLEMAEDRLDIAPADPKLEAIARSSAPGCISGSDLGEPATEPVGQGGPGVCRR